jgi:hypothetical protein
MNARNFRIRLNLSPLDFPAIIGLGKQSDITRTEPPTLVNNKVGLTIIKAFILTDVDTNKSFEVFTAQSIYEIPVSYIKSRVDVYEFYKDAQLTLGEAYQWVQKQVPQLPALAFPTPPIETYQREIDGVFYLLNSQN